MVRNIRVIYTDSVDPDWTPLEVDEILLAPDMVLESTEEEPFIFLLDYPVKEDQSFVYIDRETCKRFYAEFLDSEMDLDWLTKASFLQVVRGFAKGPREK
ncbi:hypothetical protein COJ96_06795 [Bacillus sp. AFS073361]|uniref:hypothetical protein n=1 Tax=Bacillus sp. AFS073361 TaxID=2033511 RepID=UPI000BF482D4|nr:hypothetical protein [Bacillus sp. AFS073361]PFP30121.1 hypothetical protein COJ96_06795 [Bacillus sp. AFS073361]